MDFGTNQGSTVNICRMLTRLQSTMQATTITIPSEGHLAPLPSSSQSHALCTYTKPGMPYKCRLYIFSDILVASPRAGSFFGWFRVPVLSSLLALFVKNIKPFIQTLTKDRPLTVCSTVARKFIQSSVLSQANFNRFSVVLAVALYMILFALLNVEPQLSRFWSRAMFCIWSIYMCAIISITSQGASTFFKSNASHSTITSARAEIQASFILQLVLNICFFIILALFQRRFSKAGSFEGTDKTKVGNLSLTLYTLGALMLVHNIYRTIQIFSPASSAAWKTEALYWVFDAVPLLLFSLILNVVQPVRLLQHWAKNVGLEARFESCLH